MQGNKKHLLSPKMRLGAISTALRRYVNISHYEGILSAVLVLPLFNCTVPRLLTLGSRCAT